MTQTPSHLAADVRAEIARRQVPIYRLASRVGLHPSHLGQALRGRRPLSPDLAQRIWRALSEEIGATPAHDRTETPADGTTT